MKLRFFQNHKHTEQLSPIMMHLSIIIIIIIIIIIVMIIIIIIIIIVIIIIIIIVIIIIIYNNNNKSRLERTNWALAPVSQEHGLVHLLSRRWAFACLMMPFVLPLA